MIDLSVPQRQSPLAIVFLGLRILRSLGIAQIVIVVLFIMRAPFNGALSVLPFVIIVAFGGFSALAWWRYTFQVLDDELVVTKGIVRVVRLNVPIERIQSIAIEQQLLHRLTGLVKVAVDTAGSNEAEFSIDAVARPVAEELQRRAVTAVPTPVKIGSALPPPVLAEDRVVFTHDGRRLLAMALTTWPLTGLLVLGPLLAFGGDFFNRLPDVGLGDQPFRWWWVPVGIAGFIVFSIVLNIIRVFLQDWELSLRASATSLRRTSGLLSRTSTASSVDRIQMVTSAQNPLQRRAGLRGIELATVGQRNLSVDGCDDAQFTTVLTLAAVTPIEELLLDRRIHPAAVWLAVRNATVVCALLTGALFWLIGWWSPLALTPIPLVWATTRLHVANFRWGLGQQLASSSHVLSLRTEQAVLHKTNAVTVTQSIFERRRGLGRVQLMTASGAISIGMIPIEEAHAARDTILHAVEIDTRPWI
ncbi:PH domain-containing protein [Ilumatobacter sp.]|jgi:putative membrane protein|uniref:PH domain-containing protein n=1 Tax=Ilumatobacter sp. TaxID=1967498 RepID=UPI00374ECAC9|nr:PH domain-containing protein [Ilumatobacter sp.]